MTAEPRSDDDRVPPPWLIVTGIIVALGVIFVLGVGYGQQWGAPQWGPLAEWVAGAATFGAVVVALREAARGQRAREIDYEISRRRECITALGNLWGAIIGVSINVKLFTDYLDALDEQFELDEQSRTAQLGGPAQTNEEEVYGRFQEFFIKWATTVEPPVFNAGMVLRSTPFYGALNHFNSEIRVFRTQGFSILQEPVSQGRRPDTAPFMKMWGDVLNLQPEHSKLAYQHFSLDRRDVERCLRQSRRR